MHKGQKDQPSNGSPQLEWHTCDTDAEWQARSINTSTLSTGQLGTARQPNWVVRHWRIGVLLLMAIAGLGIWTWSVAQRGLEQIESEVREGIEVDLWTTSTDNQVFDKLITSDDIPVGQHLKSTFQLLTLRGETAIVRLVIQPGPNQPLLRQTRVYQRTELGWRRIAPTPVLWGAPRRLQTNYFDFHYYTQDEEAVLGAAVIMDSFYYSMATTLHSSIPTGVKIRIEVDPTQTPGSIVRRPNLDAPLIVPSPAIYLAPVNMSETDLLAQALALSVFNESARQVAVTHWRPLLDGLRLWQLWEVDLPLASLQEPLTHRILAELENPQAHSFLGEPAFNMELCALYQLWMESPLEIQIPIPCGKPSWEKDYRALVQAAYRPPLTLAQLVPGEASPLEWHPYRAVHPGYAVALATMVDYAVDTYGRARLPLWVASLPEHQSWETLAPAVFGISASDFEAGWHSYLAEKYNVSLTQ